MSIVLDVRDVWKSYGELQVLKGVTFSVGEKEVKVVFGPSGSGKSTLLRCINMLDPPDKGEVLLKGQSLMEDGVNLTMMRARIGMVFQQFNLFSHLKALDNVTIGPQRVLGLEREEAVDRAHVAIEQVQMTDWIDHYPAQLSGGQQQRIGIARALAMDPDVVLFDEPTSALDPELIGEVLQVMLDIAQAGTTMIVVTHEMGFARAVANEMLFIDDGIIVETGTPKHFFTAPENERVRQFLHRLEVLYGGQESVEQ
ncbi:MAG: amino acid ABC transporter ATP-binding protein [Candidatus Thorarchaeota archaeon]|nr:MAG: amino acid ABC transporter ATP-binding protein [Candidatus Thorarchaeota archaeon]